MPVVPYKILLDGVQCWDENGNEYFLTVLLGRHPVVNDTLRVHGVGYPTPGGSGRGQSMMEAERRLAEAYHALQNKSRTPVADAPTTA